MTEPDHDVIVIGAGAAGIAATRELVAAGRDVLCLEAAARVGGRTHTDTQIFGQPFDIGAHWMHCEHVNALKAPGLAMGLDLYPAPDNATTHGLEDDAVLWDEVTRVFADAKAAMQEDSETQARSGAPTDLALGDVFSATGPWAATVKMMASLSMARDLPDISLRDMSTWVGGDDWFCREGFGTLVTRLAEGQPIHLSTPVTAIEVAAGHVRVRAADATLTARAVIVTASVGVLAEDVIRFDPPLTPERRRALDLITMGDYNHTALLFRPGTLPVEPDTWLTYRIEAEKAGVPQGGGFLCNISGSALTCMETSGGFSRDLQAAGADAAIEHALETLAGIFGTAIRPAFQKGQATAWRHEPFVRGSYSGALPGGSGQREMLREPHAMRIHFAGEATHRGQSASVSGAWLEGARAARDTLVQLGA